MVSVKFLINNGVTSKIVQKMGQFKLYRVYKKIVYNR